LITGLIRRNLSYSFGFLINKSYGVHDIEKGLFLIIILKVDYLSKKIFSFL